MLALRDKVPADIDPVDIDVKPGALWIPASDIAYFIRYMLETTQFWIWDDETRRENLTRLHNDIYNTHVDTIYDGSHLILPGKVSDDVIELRPHQKSFIWRVLQSSTTLADHTVGASKTFAAIGAVMELRRTGQAKKPMVVVPNHLMQQWAVDFIKLYPGANILAATKKDFEVGNRKRFFARVAAGDYDAVVVAHSSFGLIGVDPVFEQDFLQMQVDDIEDSIRTLEESEGKSSRSVNQMAKQRETLQPGCRSFWMLAAKIPA